MNLQAFHRVVDENPLTDFAPAFFIGHGNPMNALLDNAFTQSLAHLGRTLERPKAVLVISAHWLTMHETRVSVNPNPETIYDFGGFPPALYAVKYEPAGHPVLAQALKQQVASIQVHEDHEMGLDHGAWTVLKHIYPQAEVPVFQMSIDYAKPPAFHFALAQELQKLRQKGVMILGSGNIVHNLRRISWQDPTPTPDWALEFDTFVKDRIAAADYQALIHYAQAGQAAQLAVPSNDHYLPLLYTVGVLQPKERLESLYEGFQNGSISMRCFQSV